MDCTMASMSLATLDLQDEDTVSIPSPEVDTHSLEEELVPSGEDGVDEDDDSDIHDQETLLIESDVNNHLLPAFDEEETLLIDISLEDTENAWPETEAAVVVRTAEAQVYEARDVHDGDVPSSDLFPMGQLPAELQGKILGYLTKSEKLMVRNVCKTWAELIGPNCCRLTDNPAVLKLLSQAVFKKVNTLIVEDFSQTELSRDTNGDVVPNTVKKLQFDGFLNLPESVKLLMDHYCDYVEKLTLNQYCLAKIDIKDVGTWEFSNLHEISFTMAVPMNEHYRVKNKRVALCMHLHNWIAILERKLPKLNSINGQLVITKQNDKLKFKPKFEPTFANLIPNFLTKLETFATHHIRQLTKFNFREELYAHQLVKRWRQGMVNYFEWRHLYVRFDNLVEFASYHRTNELVLIQMMREDSVDFKQQMVCRYLNYLENDDFYCDYIYIVLEYTKCEDGSTGQSGKFPVDVRMTIYHSDVIA